MIHEVAIGPVAAHITTGGSTLSASAHRGCGGHGDGVNRSCIGRAGYRHGRVYGAEERYRHGREPIGRAGWCRFRAKKCGRRETHYRPGAR